jgi:hypothetical protein
MLPAKCGHSPVAFRCLLYATSGHSRIQLSLKKENPGILPGVFLNRGFSALPFRLLELLRPLALAKPHPRAAAVFVNEFDASPSHLLTIWLN